MPVETPSPEYLVSYGTSGEFARFRPVTSVAFQRGERVVVRTHQGLELGTILCVAQADHAPFLSRTAQGQLLRTVTDDDEKLAQQARDIAQLLFEEARRMISELELPLVILDVEVLLDGEHAIVHHLRQAECDYRPLVSALSKRHEVHIVMSNLALPQEQTIGCGEPNCGQLTGGCQSCGSGGCDTCGKGAKKEDVAAHLLALRQLMEQRNRTSLL
jgi:cell fate regulator YaaT (PSP1 superfamily)